MLNPLLNSTTVPLLEKVAVFGERRQGVLAGNIANIDTPDYRMRDLPVEAFERALHESVAARNRQPPSLGADSLVATPPPPTFDQVFTPNLFRAVEAAPEHLTFQDANNRSIETEVMKLTKNLMRQQFAVELMAAQMTLLQAVISERP